MSTVGKELQLVLLDVGPDMHPYLPKAARNLFNLAAARLLNKPSIEMGLVFFGTNDTDNELNREMLKLGEEGQYTNIVVAHELRCVSMDLLRALRPDAVPRGGGPSDWVNAVLLALDMMLKADAKFNLKKYPRRMVLISTFTSPTDLDKDLRASMVDSLRRTGLALEVIVVGEEPWGGGGGNGGGGGGDGRSDARDASMEVLSGLLSDVTGSIREAPSLGDVAGMFQAVYKDGNASYSGPFTLGTTHINVKVYKKTNPEPVTYNASSWELKRYAAPKPNQPHDDGFVALSREMRVANDLDGDVVTPQDTLGAYKYGKGVIPVRDDDEALLAYHPDKGLALLGFVDAEGENAVPRHYLGCSQTKGCFVVLGEKEPDAVAVSALARAMARDNKAAVVRCVFRAKGVPGLYLLNPLLAPPKSDQALPQYDCLVMNRLPFSDDFRYVSLPTFDPLERKEVQPTPEQQAAMAAVVDSLDLMALGPGGREAFRPEDTISPVQQRLYNLIGMRALDESYKMPDGGPDPLLAAACEPPAARFSKKANKALGKLPLLFKTQAPKTKQSEAEAEAKAAAAAAAAVAAAPGAAAEGVLRVGEGGTHVVKEVGMATPVDDFDALLEGGKVEDALRGMEEVIPRILEDSVGPRLYSKAGDCVARLREACVKLTRPAPFNDLIGRLFERFEGDPLHTDFAKRLLHAHVGPITTDEVLPGTEGAVSPAAARTFLQRGDGGQAEAAPAAQAQAEEDELAGME